MSQRESSEQDYLSRSPARTDRPLGQSKEDLYRPQHTQRQLHGDSPTKHDVQFYVRKVNRYEAEIARIEHDLSVAKFRLSKAEDIEIKYDILFRQNQKSVSDSMDAREQLDNTRKEFDKLYLQHSQANQLIKSLRKDLDSERRNSEDLRQKREELRTKSTSQGQEDRQNLKESFTKELETLKEQNRDIVNEYKNTISELKGTINMKEVIESSLATKLEHIKKEKNAEISRLKELVTGLRDDLGEVKSQNQDKSRKDRSNLINETEDRISNVRKLAQLIESTLMQEINDLNNTLTKKNEEIKFLLSCDKSQLEAHQNSEDNLKKLIGKLEDKIFSIQRENELQLYSAIERLTKQYKDNLSKAQDEWSDIRLAHNSTVQALRKQIGEQKNEIELMNSQNLNLQTKHKEMARDHEHTANMFSQKIIGMTADLDERTKNYTTSMRQIEDDAKVKLDDLHSAIKNKNTENEILNAQITLKNGEITHLLEQIDRLREISREKLKKIEDANAGEQDALNNQISDLKKRILGLKSKIHELDGKISDDEASHQLESELMKAELQSQKEANELLKSRNAFLNEWCEQLDRDVKAERVSNVNILHDHNITHRENVQVREQVRVELEARKDKEIEQRQNVHKLEKNRLEQELGKREHDLRDKKEELGRLLVQYKHLQAKMGKSTKVDRSAQDEGKCRATLQSEILLTENIFNAINRQ